MSSGILLPSGEWVGDAALQLGLAQVDWTPELRRQYPQYAPPASTLQNVVVARLSLTDEAGWSL